MLRGSLRRRFTGFTTSSLSVVLSRCSIASVSCLIHQGDHDGALIFEHGSFDC